MSSDDIDTALPPDEPTLHERPDDDVVSTTGPAQAPPQAGEQGATVEDDGMLSNEALREMLKAVVDPEIGYNVVDLGLVYDVTKDPDTGNVHVLMTLTSMGCPLTELIDQQVNVVIMSLPGVQSVDVEFTFSPPWSPDMMSEDTRLELRAMGMNV